MKRYFNTYSIKSGLIIAIFFSLPLYLIHFGIDNKLLNSILIISGFYFLYQKNLSSYPWFGFFSGIFWLWWIGVSFYYYNLSFVIPFIILIIGIFYWIIFYIFTLLKNKILVIVTIFIGLIFIKPFGFNWFRFDIILPHTYFYQAKQIPPANLKIKTIITHILQNKKWDKNFIPIEINNNFKYIIQAIKEKYDVIVLPESAFPLPLNKYPFLLQKLKQLSTKITIITGALSYKNKNYYNSTYLFQNSQFKIFNKHILVPFGEYIPIPCCKKWINKIFFDGASDYIASKDFSSYKIKNIKFLNAICYEATNENLYKKDINYIIALSNNAWFYPSIEPTLQKLIIEYFSLKYNKFVYHSFNYPK